MRSTIPRTALALAALGLLLTGCGTQPGTGSAGSATGTPSAGRTVSPAPSSSPSTTSPSTASPSTASPKCAPPAELGAGDSGRTVCVAVGGVVRVNLDGTREKPWKALTVSGEGLEATNSGLVLRPGDASGAYRAVAAGTARLASDRPLCATGPGEVACQSLQEWWVTVVVG